MASNLYATRNNEPVELRRDPFARATLMRQLSGDSCTCEWCGSRTGRFNYWWEPDGFVLRAPTDLKGFCSVSCWSAYNE